MKYRRKTIDKWKHQAVVTLLGFTVVALLVSPIKDFFNEAFANEFISPVAQDPIVIRTVIETEYVVPETVEEIICSIFEDNCEQAKKVAWCESRLNPKAANKNSSARGLFQIMSSIHGVRPDWLFDPTINTLIAKKLYDASGWNPWNASRSCWQ